VGGLTKAEPRCQPSPNEKLTQQSHNEPSPVFKEAGVGKGEAVEAAEEEGEGEELEVDRKAEEEVGEGRRINKNSQFKKISHAFPRTKFLSMYRRRRHSLGC
jgi:hypothetical protein